MPTAGSIQGLRSQGGDGQITVNDGTARDSTDQYWLTVPTGETRTLDISTSGPGGLDAAVQANTAYALYIVQASGTPTKLIGSTSFTAPSVPSGAVWRRIGCFCTDASAKIVAFAQHGTSNDRHVQYTAAVSKLRVLDSGNATSFTEVELLPLVGPTGESADIRVVPAGGTATIRPHGGGTEQSTSTPETFPLYVPNWSHKADYKVDVSTTTASLFVLAMDEVV